MTSGDSDSFAFVCFVLGWIYSCHSNPKWNSRNENNELTKSDRIMESVDIVISQE